MVIVIRSSCRRIGANSEATVEPQDKIGVHQKLYMPGSLGSGLDGSFFGSVVEGALRLAAGVVS